MTEISTMEKLTAISEPSNDGEETLSFSMPYVVRVTVEGTTSILFHRWSNEAVEAKAKAAKGSREKKTDNIESYVYRNAEGELCLPGEYLRQAIIYAAKFRQDPRSPRKSAMDLFKAGVVSLTELASFGTQDWDYLDQRRVVVQRSAITRTRPALLAGWRVEIELQVLLSEYIPSQLLHSVLIDAGRLIGVGDFRPTYGRFQVVQFEVI